MVVTVAVQKSSAISQQSFLDLSLDLGPGDGLVLVLVTGLDTFHFPTLPALHQLSVRSPADRHCPGQVPAGGAQAEAGELPGVRVILLVLRPPRSGGGREDGLGELGQVCLLHLVLAVTAGLLLLCSNLLVVIDLVQNVKSRDFVFRRSHRRRTGGGQDCRLRVLLSGESGEVGSDSEHKSYEGNLYTGDWILALY